MDAFKADMNRVIYHTYVLTNELIRHHHGPSHKAFQLAESLHLLSELLHQVTQRIQLWQVASEAEIIENKLIDHASLLLTVLKSTWDILID